MQIADNDAMRLRRRLQSLVLRQDKELKPQNPTTNDLRHSALFQVQDQLDQVKVTAECIGSSRWHRRKPVAACGNKKLWESSEISITKTPGADGCRVIVVESSARWNGREFAADCGLSSPPNFIPPLARSSRQKLKAAASRAGALAGALKSQHALSVFLK